MKENRKNTACEEIKQAVLTLELAPGTTLEEARLSEQYGLSRTPLREVLQRLAGSGYVNLTANRGATVASMDLPTMRSFFQTAPLIYASVARLAADQATSIQMDKLKKIQSQFKRAVTNRNVGDMVFLNHRFHEFIGVMAANPYLQPSLGRLLIDHARMSHTFYQSPTTSTSQRVRTACDQHDAMISAIETHDASAAVNLTRDHWELSRSELEHYVHPDPLPLDVAETHRQTAVIEH